MSTATHLLNLRPCQTSGTMTPHHLLLGSPPPTPTSKSSAVYAIQISRRLPPTNSVPVRRRVFSSAIPPIIEDTGVWISNPVGSLPLATWFLTNLNFLSPLQHSGPPRHYLVRLQCLSRLLSYNIQSPCSRLLSSSNRAVLRLLPPPPQRRLCRPLQPHRLLRVRRPLPHRHNLLRPILFIR